MIGPLKNPSRLNQIVLCMSDCLRTIGFTSLSRWAPCNVDRLGIGEEAAAAAARPWCCRRPPRPPPVRRSVAPWEKDYCESRGVPWRKVTDPGAGLNAEGPGGRVARWDDSGAVEALLAARKRYWAEISGGIGLAHAGGVPPLPDSDMYVDVVVDDAGGSAVDPAVEAEYEAAVWDMERARLRAASPARKKLCADGP